jgi:hypothetical protein
VPPPSREAPGRGTAEGGAPATYEVVRAGASEPGKPAPEEAAIAAAAPSRRPYAVFVVHGMGEQIPFQTIELVAEGLRRAGGAGGGKPRVASVLLDGERLSRAEIELRDASGAPREIHVYEGYWAPLTEGVVRLRDVIGFLFRGATNGIWNAARKRGFRRWLFDEYRAVAVPASALLALLAALGVVLGLLALNASIVVAAMARLPLNSPPPWLGDGLFRDLTTAAELVIASLVFFALTLLLSKALRRIPPASLWRRGAGALSVFAGALAIGAISLAGISLPLLFRAHIQCGPDVAGRELLPHLLGTRFVRTFDDLFELGTLFFIAGALAFLIIIGAFKVLAGAVREWRAGGRRAVFYAVGLAGVATLVVAFAGEVRAAVGLCREVASLSLVKRGISWPLLFVLSAWVRSLLVQYPGDVAAYVGSHTLDRFADLRGRIKETVGKKAHAVYGARDATGGLLYAGCVLVGHSLGSVIAYDTLNRLILDDETAGADAALDAVGRTPLFLTLGSPLDKTAFIFGIQGKNTSEGREALAASVQPMICEYRLRPRRWVNVHAPWDLVSGPLDLYDSADTSESKRVENIVDREATTLLAAHLEYWRNPLMFEILHRELIA